MRFVISLFLFLFFTTILIAVPRGEKVIAGDAFFSKGENLITINASHNTIIEYQNFDILSNEAVRFIQPTSTSKVLNRVIGLDPSKIEGSLTSNGLVYLVNPHGIFFGKNAIVDVGALFAIAGHLANEDFLNGINRAFDLHGKISNEGIIKAKEICLLAAKIENFGLLKADNIVAIVSNENILVAEKGNGVFVEFSPSPNKAKDSFVESCDFLALSSSSICGKDILIATDEKGCSKIYGEVKAYNPESQTGGRITLLGSNIKTKDAKLIATGEKKGGEIFIGKAENTILNTKQLNIENGIIDASCLLEGPGGNILLYSTEKTSVACQIFATGAKDGRGGFLETSSDLFLDVNSVKCDLGSPCGKVGKWLIDPTNIYIVASDWDTDDLTKVSTFLEPNIGINGTSLKVDAINSAVAQVDLQAQENIYFGAFVNATQNIDAQAGSDIIVTATLSSSGNISLTANSSNSPVRSGSGSIQISKPVFTTGSGELTMTIDGGSGSIAVADTVQTVNGDMTFQIQNGSGSITINDDIISTGSGSIYMTTSGTSADITIEDIVATTGTGNIDITSTSSQGSITLSDVVSSNGAGTSQITLTNSSGNLTTNALMSADNGNWSIGIYGASSSGNMMISDNITYGGTLALFNEGSGSITIRVNESTSSAAMHSIDEIMDSITGAPSSIVLNLVGTFSTKAKISHDNVKFSGNILFQPILDKGVYFDANCSNTIFSYCTLNAEASDYCIDLNSNTITNLNISSCIFSGQSLLDTNGIGNGSIAGICNIANSAFSDFTDSYVCDIAGNASMTSAYFYSNTISNTGGAVNISGPATSSATVSYNTFSTVNPGDQPSACAVSGFNSVTFINNTFSNISQGTVNGEAIRIYNIGSLTFSLNQLNNCYEGLFIYGGPGPGYYAIPSGFARFNNITHDSGFTSIYAIKVDPNATGTYFNAPANYFGSINQPTTDSPSTYSDYRGNVYYTSWLGNSATTFYLLFFTKSDIGIPPRTNIQDTINLMTINDKLVVLEGTYNENVYVNKFSHIYFQNATLNQLATTPFAACLFTGKVNGDSFTFNGATEAFFNDLTMIDLGVGNDNFTINTGGPIIFNGTLDSSGTQMSLTFAASSLIFLAPVGKNSRFYLMDITQVPCSGLYGTNQFYGITRILTNCSIPFPNNPVNPVNPNNVNFGTAKITSSNQQIINVIDQAQQIFLRQEEEALKKKECDRKKDPGCEFEREERNQSPTE